MNDGEQGECWRTGWRTGLMTENRLENRVSLMENRVNDGEQVGEQG